MKKSKFTETQIVSIQAPARGATRVVVGVRGGTLGFQSTRPRGARLSQSDLAPLRRRVSIHAPVRGATKALCT